jgi:hypothetical protein
MALFNIRDFSHDDRCDTNEIFIRPTDNCFYCGNPLVGDWFIYWQGADDLGQQIWFHMDCAKRFSDALNKDFHQFQTGTRV